ncbi:hypothetical protein CCY99_03715 [Helicobacter sp. 16-1353]|uniref:SPOR domain-containing protein n=1 Tax=Helicobacter sp. 16-1353 TaxID=2004996 RepID=UPI000DCF1CE2|nr:SPOR domain-containing protein [Helicobacter sp. 16-1353]RAX54467.1 hypothetical protein CCY99_03715 [Helicobacter sp. 16-1353]
MDDKRELNDILIGGEDSRAKQTKKLILLIAAIIVLVIAIVVIALSMTGSKEEEETIIIGTENVNPALPDSSFDNVPVNNEEDQFEKIVKEIKARQQSSESQTPPTAPVAPVTPTESAKATMPSKAQQATKPVISSQPRVATATTTSNRTTASSAFRGNNGDIAESGYYLQVGAFSKTPNKTFMDNINKYSYRVQEIMINSKVITRYLVGPYASRSDAQKDYNNVSRDITTPVFLEVQ